MSDRAHADEDLPARTLTVAGIAARGEIVNNLAVPAREISTEVDGVVYFGHMTIQERMVTVTTGLTSKSGRRGRYKAETVARRLLAEIIREEATVLRE